jgi:DNA-binding transcriptional ArsR family regulator
MQLVQHLSVLVRSRLVRSSKRGRVRTYEIAPERFKVVEDWLSARRQQWEARLKMLFPGYRPAVFDDIPITAIVTMESVGSGTRYVFTALHRNEADLATNKASGFYQGTQIAIDQFVAHVLTMK